MLAALRLLRAVLDRDAELVAAIRAATHSGGLSYFGVTPGQRPQ